jgi:hypothetical protein
MIDTGHLPQLAPEALFVIACPVCHGHVAATRGLCGRDACCPLCANLFRVPGPALSRAASATTTSPGLAEDWGGVIEQLAPPERTPEPAPEAVQYPRMSYVFGASRPSGPSDETVGYAEAELPIPFDAVPPPAEAPPPVASVALPFESDATVDATSVPEELTPDAAELVDAFIVASDATEPAATPVDFPHMGPALLEPGAMDLELREPVRTIRHGDTVIEIRRLTPAERRSRRFRRNLMMIIIGVSILLAIVVIFGVPEKPSR